jgi:ABC-2 type transport system permease protein
MIAPLPSEVACEMKRLPGGPAFGDALLGILRLTWSGLLAWRRIPGLIALVFASPLLATIALAASRDHQSEGFRMWILNLHANFMVPIACLLSAGSMIRDEIQAGTLPFLITRPIRRSRLVLLKYVCHVAWLEVVLGLNATVLTLCGMALRIDGAFTMGLWLLGIQTLLIPAFAGVSVLLGLISKRYLLLGILYGCVVETGFGQIPTNINVLSLSRHFQGLMGKCAEIGTTVPLPAWGVPGSLLAIALIGGVALAASMVLFSEREFLETDAPR